jgi:hypothetical protein
MIFTAETTLAEAIAPYIRVPGVPEKTVLMLLALGAASAASIIEASARRREEACRRIKAEAIGLIAAPLPA